MAMHSQQRHYEIDATRMEMKQILKALSKGRMRAYIILFFITFFLLFAGTVLTALLMYDGFDEAVIGAIVIFGLLSFLLGIIAFACYPWFLRGSIKWLIKTDSLYCINDLLNGFVTYDPVTKFSFGDTFLYTNLGFLIRYEDIVWAYHSITNHSVELIPTGKSESIIVGLINGRKYSLVTKKQARKKLVDAQSKSLSERISDEILTKNTDILFGYTDENEKKYERIITEWKENDRNSGNGRNPTERTETEGTLKSKSLKTFLFIINIALFICSLGFMLIGFPGEIFGSAMTERLLDIFNIPLSYGWFLLAGNLCVAASVLLYYARRRWFK